MIPPSPFYVGTWQGQTLTVIFFIIFLTNPSTWNIRMSFWRGTYLGLFEMWVMVFYELFLLFDFLHMQASNCRWELALHQVWSPVNSWSCPKGCGHQYGKTQVHPPHHSCHLGGWWQITFLSFYLLKFNTEQNRKYGKRLTHLGILLHNSTTCWIFIIVSMW